MRHTPPRAALPPFSLPLLWLAALRPGRSRPPGQACETRAAREFRTCDNAVAREQLSVHEEHGRDLRAEATRGSRVASPSSRAGARRLPRRADGRCRRLSGGAHARPGLVARLQEAVRQRRDDSGRALLRRPAGRGARRRRPHAAGLPRQRLRPRPQRSSTTRSGSNSSCLPARTRAAPAIRPRSRARIAAREAARVAAVGRRCPDLRRWSPSIRRCSSRARSTRRAAWCATAHGQTAPLTLACGPRAAVPVPPRGVPTQVVLPHASSGTRCGNGSDYAFHIHLAPAGTPVEKIVVLMQGGGVVRRRPGCAGQPADLFDAINDALPSNGMMSSTAADQPVPRLDEGVAAILHAGRAPRRWRRRRLPGDHRAPLRGASTSAPRCATCATSSGRAWTRPIRRASAPIARCGLQRQLGGRLRRGLQLHWVLDDLGWVHTTAAAGRGARHRQRDPV